MIAKRRAVALLAAAGSALLAPVLLAGPAFADETPLPDEPPGGATCAPEIPATDCQQEDPGSTPAPTPSPTKATSAGLPATGGKGSGSGSTSGTGSTAPAPALARTGASDPGRALGLAAAGTLVLVAGSGLVAAGRRTARA